MVRAEQGPGNSKSARVRDFAAKKRGTLDFFFFSVDCERAELEIRTKSKAVKTLESERTKMTSTGGFGRITSFFCALSCGCSA